MVRSSFSFVVSRVKSLRFLIPCLLSCSVSVVGQYSSLGCEILRSGLMRLRLRLRLWSFTEASLLSSSSMASECIGGAATRLVVQRSIPLCEVSQFIDLLALLFPVLILWEYLVG
ncbi:unnamed protein product [Arabis nemorensis]|uniref:Uncharacterized protein n=1 Tax=Arabis nemorensis TaxID=586526 RepID=A0A565ASQ0_9BRAS|nr:unnamed protein product [Arabis nemorensis]